MALIACAFSALGTAIGSALENMQGFQLIMNFLVMPIFFLSGALYPLTNLPPAFSVVVRLDPLAYGVDGLRTALIGVSHFGHCIDALVLIVVAHPVDDCQPPVLANSGLTDAASLWRKRCAWSLPSLLLTAFQEHLRIRTEVCNMPFFCLLLLSVILFPALAQQYKLEPLSVPDDWLSPTVKSINNRGAMVGTYRKRNFGTTFGFKRDANGVFEFPIKHPDSGRYTFPLDINDSGVIVGYYYDASIVPYGFLLTGGPGRNLHQYGRTITGINNRGDFAGSYERGIGFLSVGGTVTQFMFPRGTTEVWGIAWDRTVIGSSYLGNDTIGFIRGPAGKFLGFRIPNAVTTIPLAINNEAGKIVGYYQDSLGIHGFVYDYVADLMASDGTIAPVARTVPVQTIDYPGGVWTYVTGINAKGVIVGHTANGRTFTGTPQ